MKLRRWTFAACLFAATIAQAKADPTFTVAFAGSMGVVMDKGLGPAFQAQSGAQYQGYGQGALALAHLITGKSLNPDVFISVSPGPMKIVEAAGLADTAIPIASTEIVLAYGPKSKFAHQLAAAKAGAWTSILENSDLHFGRTDPKVDPQGQYVLYTLQLAGLYYNQPDLESKVAGDMENPAEIFAEPSLLARLQDGQIDATLGYESAVISQKLPFLTLPAEINFSTPSLAKTWYDKAALTMTEKGVTKTSHPGSLVFYAAALKNAPDPDAAAAFLKFLQSPQAQAILKEYGYNQGKGPAI
jgi:molybdate/tungstate transport system substrate-binding protein